MKPTTMNLRRRRQLLMLGGLLVAGGVLTARRAMADDQMPMDHMHMDGMGNMDHMDHSAHEHHHPAVPPTVKRSLMALRVPDLTLVRQDGKSVHFPAEIDDGRPVVLDFIYTSCTEICPVTSQIFSEFQKKLGAERAKVHLVSISIDPEYDTPSRLSAYGKKYEAGPQWQHYTGTQEASVAMQRAFDVYRGDKMNHFPVTFLRPSPDKPWVRLEGFATPDVLLQEYNGMTKG
jgi:protein SCO1/2